MSGSVLAEAEIQMTQYATEVLTMLCWLLDQPEGGRDEESVDELAAAAKAFAYFPPSAWWRGSR